MAFADNLQQLPSIDHLAELRLMDAQGQVAAVIPNQPGKAGSLRLYAALAAKHGSLNAPPPRKGWSCLPSTRSRPASTPAAIRTSTACSRSSPRARATPSSWWRPESPAPGRAQTTHKKGSSRSLFHS